MGITRREAHRAVPMAASRYRTLRFLAAPAATDAVEGSHTSQDPSPWPSLGPPSAESSSAGPSRPSRPSPTSRHRALQCLAPAMADARDGGADPTSRAGSPRVQRCHCRLPHAGARGRERAKMRWRSCCMTGAAYSNGPSMEFSRSIGGPRAALSTTCYPKRRWSMSLFSAMR